MEGDASSLPIGWAACRWPRRHHETGDVRPVPEALGHPGPLTTVRPAPVVEECPRPRWKKCNIPLMPCAPALGGGGVSCVLSIGWLPINPHGHVQGPSRGGRACSRKDASRRGCLTRLAVGRRSAGGPQAPPVFVLPLRFGATAEGDRRTIHVYHESPSATGTQKRRKAPSAACKRKPSGNHAPGRGVVFGEDSDRPAGRPEPGPAAGEDRSESVCDGLRRATPQLTEQTDAKAGSGY